MLETYLAEQTSVTMALQNKTRVSGKIKAFDSYVIIMEGQKREIVYRHAVSCIAPNNEIEQKHKPQSDRVKSVPSRSEKPFSQKPRTTQSQASSPAKETPNLSNTMKDGLLKWMQEQKAAK
jgi:RNA chaperone Hfq